jgi:hypothetical protein
MKTRYYLKRIKQKQNETQMNIYFVFHCSGLTSHQWRHLKNVFYIESNGSFQTRHKSGPLCFLSTLVSKQNQLLLQHGGLDNFGLFSKPICDLFAEIGNHSKTDLERTGETPLETKNLRQTKINVNLSRLFTKVNSLEGIHMMLLYAQIESSLFNHVDIQASPGWSLRFGPSMESNAQVVLGLFFQSCFLDVQHLTYYLSAYSSQIKVKNKIGEEKEI